jgi:hypothetical protein
MTGFAVYSSEYNPQRLYSDGNPESIETSLIEEIVRFGDRPLDLYVDLEQRQLLWSFKAERHTTSARTGYFLAAYQGTDEDLFRGFEEKLRRLHDSEEWAIPHTGELRWDIGFDLWRVPAEAPGPTNDRLQDVTERLREGDLNRPIEFGMRTHRSALQVVRALDEADVSCTVAVGAGGDVATLSNVDLLLRPGAERDFEPLSTLASEIDGAKATGIPPEPTESRNRDHDRSTSGSLLSRVSSAVLLVFLGFAAYSFVEPSPVQPLTGLSTLGGLLGSLAAIVTGTWVLDTQRSERDVSWEWVQEAITADTDRTLIVLAYGSLLGFGFPRIMWEFGSALGNDGFLFGPITTLPGSLLTGSVYVLCILAVNLLVLTLRAQRKGSDTLSRQVLSAVTAGHFAYVFFLVFATGFASSLWFPVIPSATP